MKENWAIKYRPSTLTNYVFPNEEYKQSFSKMVDQKNIPHLLLSGSPGTGKSTLARILINNMPVDQNVDVKIINASDQNSVDDMRNEIMDFINSYAMGDFKIVLLEEADYLSLNAQALLRTPLEDPNISARFILTCNQEHKIMPAIKSRVEHFHFKSQAFDDVILFAADVLSKEKVKFDLDTLEQVVSQNYPDIRKTLITLQQNSTNNILSVKHATQSGGDYKEELLKFVGNNQWKSARELVCSQVSSSEWEDLYSFLYKSLNTVGKFKQQDKHDQAIVTIAEHLYKHSICSDPEINAAAMFIKLSTI